MENKEKNTNEKILEEALKLFAQSGYMGQHCRKNEPDGCQKSKGIRDAGWRYGGRDCRI